MHRALYTIGIVAAVASMMFAPASAQENAKDQPTMKDLESVDDLREQFNADSGKRRLILLLSPT